jgi:hypothetical protein
MFSRTGSRLDLIPCRVALKALKKSGIEYHRWQAITTLYEAELYQSIQVKIPSA